jgi:UPF0755 protein
VRLRWAVLGLAAVAFVSVVAYAYLSANPLGKPGPPATVSIPEGTSTPGVARVLAKAHVIHNPALFEIYAKLAGNKPLLAGTYRLATNESYSAVLSALEKGPILKELVVPEGFTVDEIARAVARLHVGISAQAFVKATEEVRSPYEPAGTRSLEGLLYPATYPVAIGESAAQLVRYMVATFDLHAKELGLVAAARRLGYTPYQVVTVASIVEEEAALNEDRGPVASTIYNRLARGMPVGAESTLVYALGGQLPKNLLQATPYNTFVNRGLPPTPIGNPGAASLEAAMHPPKTGYLFWVEVNADGKMGFASTEAGFKRLQHECQAAKLC